jgi:glycosyltransferase involved in cell wall biosynthesis
MLFVKGDIFWSNDLDTLLPNLLISRLRKKKMIYDSHEYYTQTASLVNRPLKRKIWEWVEDLCIPHLEYMLTVNHSIKSLYESRYKVQVDVLRNLPLLTVTCDVEAVNTGLDEKKILIVQGAGIHLNRGVEELVLAMQYLEKNFCLIIAGGGDAIPLLQKYTDELNLKEQVLFLGSMPYRKLIAYTKSADLGIIPEKLDVGLNSKFTLPNKFFDYIHAGIPVLSSRAVEVEKIIKQYEIGSFFEKHDPRHIAETIKKIFDKRELLTKWKQNTKQAAMELCWEKEKEVILNLMRKADPVTAEH